MALRDKSLFLYGFEVTQFNSSIDFKAASLGPTLMATLTFGFYSLTSLMTEIKRAMQAADPANIYTVTADRTFSAGLQNRVTISTSGSFLSLLFLTGPRTASTTAPLIGFAVADRTGSTSYTGTSSAGTVLVSELNGYNYLSPDFNHKIYGSVNISTSGVKEAVVFQIQKFLQVEFKYEPEAKWIVQWTPFMDWIIQQRLFEFTPEIKSPTVFYEVTLESSSADNKGLAFKPAEMLPNFPFNYQTGLLTFRQNIT